MNSPIQRNFVFLILFLTVLAGLILWLGGRNLNLPQLVVHPSTSPSPTPMPVVLGEKIIESTASAGGQRAQVTKVVDGDTIDVLIEGQKKTIRFIGINTPETVDPRRPVQCFGKEASDRNKELLSGKEVILEKDVSETDKYDRLLRLVYLPLADGQLLFVNDYLVREGYAYASDFPPDIKYSSRFHQAQIEAQTSNKGLWGRCPIASAKP